MKKNKLVLSRETILTMTDLASVHGGVSPTPATPRLSQAVSQASQAVSQRLCGPAVAASKYVGDKIAASVAGFSAGYAAKKATE